MSNKDFTVTVTDPDRAKEWQAVLGTTTVPVTTPLANTANLPGHPNAEVFYLDVKLLSKTKLTNLVIHLAQKFKVAPSEITTEMQRDPLHAIPILAEHCTVTVHNPQRWF